MNEKHKTVTQHHKEKGYRYLLYIAAVLIILTAANVYFISQSNNAVEEKVKYSKDLNIPANLELTKISIQCTDCFDVNTIVGAIKQLKANVTEKEIDSASSEAKELIKKYNITRLPTIIVSGNIAKAGISRAWSSVGTQESDGALVLRVGAPFIDALSGELRGKVDVVFLNYSSCKDCYDVTLHNSVLKSYGVAVSGNKTIDAGSSEGRALIEKYNIIKVPTVLISPEAKYYDALQSIWQQVGTMEKDGWYVFRDMAAISRATYYDLAQKKRINQTAQ